MKKLILLALILLSFALIYSASDWTQYYFRFELTNKAELNKLTELISIDNVKGNWVYAYANDWEWAEFQKLGYRTQILPNPGDLISPIMSNSLSQLREWDSYPTYTAYEAMMYQFATSYPGLCQIVDAGTTVNGRKLLFAKISDNIQTAETEPRVMYTATIHGDETTGYILMLRLIDTLLSQYGSDPRITNLVNNLEIWINPLANPDGTYYGGNTSVSGARRANANGFDLNRNFPSPTGSQYSLQTRQIETTHMINLAMANYFSLSANFHGGAEVINYPWDTWTTLHPDNTWYSSISRAYATSAQNNSPAGYLDDLNNGITNGAAWYVITGGRQDWMNYTGKGREVTMEISATKLLPASQLNAHWDYNYDALLAYLENALYGIHGVVKDAANNPLGATINVVGLDTDYTKIRTNPALGTFYRYLSPGTYTLEVSVDGYPTQTISNVTVNAGQMTPLTVTFGVVQHEQNITLNAGWNLISFNVNHSSQLPSDVLSAMGNDLIQLKDHSESYSPQVPSYFNTLSQVEPHQAYWIKSPTSQVITAQGDLFEPASQPIQLAAGWNLVSFLPDTALSPAVALGSILANVLEVKDISGSWQPSGSANTLSVMEPGKGYYINVTQSCVLIYP